jgi:hypothetical protein
MARKKQISKVTASLKSIAPRPTPPSIAPRPAPPSPSTMSSLSSSSLSSLNSSAFASPTPSASAGSYASSVAIQMTPEMTQGEIDLNRNNGDVTLGNRIESPNSPFMKLPRKVSMPHWSILCADKFNDNVV